MRSFIIVLGLLATPAVAADQFDLQCQSQVSNVRYRVDIARNEACSNKCESVWRMGESTSGELKLIDRAPAYRGDLEERSTVSRVTGDWHYVVSLDGKTDTFKGHCEPAPFSEFPAAKF